MAVFRGEPGDEELLFAVVFENLDVSCASAEVGKAGVWVSFKLGCCLVFARTPDDNCVVERDVADFGVKARGPDGGCEVVACDSGADDGGGDNVKGCAFFADDVHCAEVAVAGEHGGEVGDGCSKGRRGEDEQNEEVCGFHGKFQCAAIFKLCEKTFK